jgi:hypothetical protein
MIVSSIPPTFARFWGEHGNTKVLHGQAKTEKKRKLFYAFNDTLKATFFFSNVPRYFYGYVLVSFFRRLLFIVMQYLIYFCIFYFFSDL